MENKEKIRILAGLLDECFYFQPKEDGSVDCKYEISEDGETLHIYNPGDHMLIYGNESISTIIKGVGLTSFVHYCMYRRRLEYVVS